MGGTNADYSGIYDSGYSCDHCGRSWSPERWGRRCPNGCDEQDSSTTHVGNIALPSIAPSPPNPRRTRNIARILSRGSRKRK